MHLNTLSYDLKFTKSLKGGIEMVAGISGFTQSNTNKGIEYLIPDYNLQSLGGFLYAKKNWTKWTLNGGLRYDARWVEGHSLYLDSLGQPSLSGDTLFPGFHSNFSSFSGSSGFTFSASRVLNFKFNTGSGFRAPNFAELGSNGVHEGTFRYEIGNPSLKSENSIQIDGEVDISLKWINFSFSGYFNYIFNYIYQENTGEEKILIGDQWYPVYRFVQGNSVLKGFEVEIDIHPIEALHFDNSLDLVYGTNVTTGIPLPLIPAIHSAHELKWTFNSPKSTILAEPFISLAGQFHYTQNRTDTYETPTKGYFLLDASIGSRLRVGKQSWSIFLSGNNLTNTKYFDHLSRLKEVGIYNPGWNVMFGLLIPFGVIEK
jgi:iron complex outermembrane receptor protein